MNTRWRQIIKYLPKDDRWEYDYDQTWKRPKCPVCQSSLTVDDWNDDRGCVETQSECKCGYMDNWSYGYTTLSAGAWVGEYSYDTPNESIIKIRDEHIKQIELYRLKVTEMKRFMYLKADRRASRRTNPLSGTIAV